MDIPAPLKNEPLVYTRNLVFVIMAFDEELHPIYECIKKECSKYELVVIRADEIPGSIIIANEVRHYLKQAEFIICDLTGESQNVYYELGLAQGVGNSPLDIFLIAREGTQVHFNIAGFRVRYYGSNNALRKLIKKDFWEMIAERRKRDAPL
jgi:hypothetical protein